MTHNLHFTLNDNIIVASPELNARARHNRAFERRLETHTHDPSYLLQTHVNDNRTFDPACDLYAMRHYLNLTNPEELEPIIKEAQELALPRAELILNDTTCNLDTLYSDVYRWTTDYIKASHTEPTFEIIETNIYARLVSTCANYIYDDHLENIVRIKPEDVFHKAHFSVSLDVNTITYLGIFGIRTASTTISNYWDITPASAISILDRLSTVYPHIIDLAECIDNREQFALHHLTTALEAYPHARPTSIWSENTEPFRYTITLAIQEAITRSYRKDMITHHDATHVGEELDKIVAPIFTSYAHDPRPDGAKIFGPGASRATILNWARSIIHQSFVEFFHVSANPEQTQELTEGQAWNLWREHTHEHLISAGIDTHTIYSHNINYLRYLWVWYLPYSRTPIRPFIQHLADECEKLAHDIEDLYTNTYRQKFHTEYILSPKRW